MRASFTVVGFAAVFLLSFATKCDTEPTLYDVLYAAAKEIYGRRYNSFTQFAFSLMLPNDMNNTNDVIQLLDKKNRGTYFEFTQPSYCSNKEKILHTEEKLLDGFKKVVTIDKLYQKFQTTRRTLKFAIIYTFNYPCKCCADLIMKHETFKGSLKGKVRIGFTRVLYNDKHESGYNNRSDYLATRNKMNSKGFTATQVPVSLPLSPMVTENVIWSCKPCTAEDGHDDATNDWKINSESEWDEWPNGTL